MQGHIVGHPKYVKRHEVTRQAITFDHALIMIVIIYNLWGIIFSYLTKTEYCNCIYILTINHVARYFQGLILILIEANLSKL